MKEFQFRLREYDDKYNVELQQRFHDCYRIDLMSNTEIHSSLITNNTVGTVFQHESTRRLAIYNTGLPSPRYTEKLLIDNELICLREKHQVTSIFNLRKSKNNWLEFSDGQVLSSTADSLTYWRAPAIIDYFQDDQLVCRLKARRPAKKFLDFSIINYTGSITYSENLTPDHLLVILQFLVIDHIFSVKSR